MKNFLKGAVAAASLFAFAGSAQAADMADMPSYWNGFYIGGQTGYYDATVSVPGPGDFDIADGVLVGGYAGYNMMLSDNFVIGLEGDFNALLGGKKIPGFDLDGFASIRGRVGYAMDATLLYVTGGAAFLLADFPGPLPPGIDETEVGFAVGGGIEHFINHSLSMKVEYLYSGFDDTFGIPQFDYDVHQVRVGAAFHF